MPSCPANPPPPSGFRVWRKPVPQALTQWAMDLRDHINGAPYGQTWTAQYAGQAVVARKDYHTWTNRRQPDGSVVLVTGICIPGITLYEGLPVGAVLGGLDLGDPIAHPDPAAAVYGADDVQPPATTDWGAVAGAGAAVALVLAGFWAVLRYGGRR